MIRNSKCLYSLGGYDPTKFTEQKKAKMWRTMGALKNHLNLVMEHKGEIPLEWIIVEIEFTATKELWARGVYEKQFVARKKEQEVQSKQRHKEYLLQEKARIEKELQTL